jgi:hypothetical protein
MGVFTGVLITYDEWYCKLFSFSETVKVSKGGKPKIPAFVPPNFRCCSQHARNSSFSTSGLSLCPAFLLMPSEPESLVVWTVTPLINLQSGISSFLHFQHFNHSLKRLSTDGIPFLPKSTMRELPVVLNRSELDNNTHQLLSFTIS